MPAARLSRILCFALTAAALFAQPRQEIIRQKIGLRYETLLNFPADATAGPRDINIFLPPNYASSEERYRVIYFHDGEGVFGELDNSRGVFVDADYAMDQLLAENLIHPTILVADEPTGDLDRKSAEEIMDLMDGLNSELGKTIIMVTHDPRAAQKAHVMRHLDKGVLNSVRTQDTL